MDRTTPKPGEVVVGGFMGRRSHHGQRVTVRSGQPTRFPNEVVRWRTVVANLESAMKAVGSAEKGLHTTLAESTAYALSRLEAAEKEEGLDYDQPTLPGF